MPQTTFYLLSEHRSQETLSSHEALACDLAGLKWRQDHRILIACESQAQAYQLDEALWQRHPQHFVPHALAGENLRFSAPVELCWPEQSHSSGRNLLISLLPDIARFSSYFAQVIDFVPDDRLLKQQARERYRAYRTAGFQITTVAAPITLPDEPHGKNL